MVTKWSGSAVGIYLINSYNEGSEPQIWEDVGPLRVRQPSSKGGSKRPLTPAWCGVRNVNSLQSRRGQT